MQIDLLWFDGLPWWNEIVEECKRLIWGTGGGMGPNPAANSTAHTHTPTSGIESIIHITSSEQWLYLHMYIYICIYEIRLQCKTLETHYETTI